MQDAVAARPAAAPRPRGKRRTRRPFRDDRWRRFRNKQIEYDHLGVDRETLVELAFEQLAKHLGYPTVKAAPPLRLEGAMQGPGVGRPGDLVVSGYEVWINRPGRYYVVRVRDAKGNGA